MNGPYPPGRYADIKIFKISLLNQLKSTERVIGDNCYTHAKFYTAKNVKYDSFRVCYRLRSHHEKVNELLKNHEFIHQKFRHHVSLHGVVSHTVDQITEMMIRESDPMFSFVKILYILN